MIGNIKKSGAGFTLMEMIVAIGIFVFAILAIMGVYTYATRGLRETTQGQKTLSEIRFDIETMAQKIRTSEIDYSKDFDLDLSEDGSSGIIDSEPELYLKNENDLNEMHYWYDDVNNSIKLQINAASPVDLIDTSNISVEKLNFYITPTQDPFELQEDGGGNLSYDANQQPKVTIVAVFKSKSARPSEEDIIYLQTTVSTRVYKR